MDKIEKLLLSGRKIFNTQDLSIIWNVSEKRKLLEVIKYYVRVGKLHRAYRGVYAINEDFSEFELAQKLVPLSYISLHSALSIHGINFQYYSTVYSVALISKHYTIGEQGFSYHQIKDFIFYNQTGLIRKETYTVADPERAVCDSLYFWPALYFDHLDNINKDKLVETAKIYRNKRLIKDVNTLIKHYLT
jgi:predicted transcriptional regulator of viral defense system